MPLYNKGEYPKEGQAPDFIFYADYIHSIVAIGLTLCMCIHKYKSGLSRQHKRGLSYHGCVDKAYQGNVNKAYQASQCKNAEHRTLQASQTKGQYPSEGALLSRQEKSRSDHHQVAGHLSSFGGLINISYKIKFICYKATM